ncbi:MAG: P1 family peptidase [Acidimicrobiales bacterium]
MITDVAGIRVGSWTDDRAATGCTVVLFPDGTVASGEVRGGAPASREVALLEPGRRVDRVDAVVLTGGSAFGLASCDGVVRFCEERGMGVPTPAGVVPIVVGLGLFDLWVGDATVRPGAEDGYAACEVATAGPVDLGAVGAATGATVGDGSGGRRPGGLGSATARAGDLVVSALVAVNAAGVVGADDESAPLAAARFEAIAAAAMVAGAADSPLGHTTIGVVATNASLDKVGCHLVAQSAHDGLARAVFPAHTRFDGDAFVAAAVGGVTADVDAVRALAVHAVAAAIRSTAAG